MLITTRYDVLRTPRFTFLATLFLLLAISSAIIMRGIFLRRRFRRRLEEAIAAGVLLSPSDDGTGGFGGNGGRTSRRKLQRPTLFDVSVLPPWFSTSSPQDGSWEKLMVSASSQYYPVLARTDRECRMSVCDDISHRCSTILFYCSPT